MKFQCGYCCTWAIAMCHPSVGRSTLAMTRMRAATRNASATATEMPTEMRAQRSSSGPAPPPVAAPAAAATERMMPMNPVRPDPRVFKLAARSVSSLSRPLTVARSSSTVASTISRSPILVRPGGVGRSRRAVQNRFILRQTNSAPSARRNTITTNLKTGPGGEPNARTLSYDPAHYDVTRRKTSRARGPNDVSQVPTRVTQSRMSIPKSLK